MYYEKAYAKINLNLEILGKRNDGFHNLESIMTMIDLHDDLFFELINEKEVLLESNVPELNNDDNLIVKVAKYMIKEFNLTKGIKIRLVKRIPIAGGLAGGSTNAAATIRAINHLFNLDLSRAELAQIGSIFGSDIPFCIYNQACEIKGRGEIVRPINNKMEMYVLVVRHDFPVSTKEIFTNVKAYDHLTKTSIIERALYENNYQLLTENIYNGLEKVTTMLYPKVLETINLLKENGIHSMLSGSGPTVLGFARTKEELLKLEGLLNRKGYSINIAKLLP